MGWTTTTPASAKSASAPHPRAGLALNARNDPFVPAHSLPGRPRPAITSPLAAFLQGGHVGLRLALPPGHIRSLPEQVLEWLQRATAGS